MPRALLLAAVFALNVACDATDELCSQFWCETRLEADLSPNIQGDGAYALSVTLGGDTSSCTVTLPDSPEPVCTQSERFDLRLDVDASAGAITAFAIDTQTKVPDANPTVLLTRDGETLYDGPLDVTWETFARPDDCGGDCRTAVWSGDLSAR